jgi:hypothetical protein
MPEYARTPELDPIKSGVAISGGRSSKIIRLPSFSLVIDPCADVCRTIRERDSVAFAFGKEVDFTLTSQRQVFQIKHYATAQRFSLEKSFQFRYVFLFHPAD